MASNPPFELEDQTDEDFFDKLVSDDDDDDVSSRTTQFIKTHDILDGNESDEVKAFANLSLGEISSQNIGSQTKGERASDESVEPDEVKLFADLSLGDLSSEGIGSKTTGVQGSDDNMGTQSVEAREEEQVVVAEADHTSVSSVFPSLDNGPVSEDAITAFEVKSDLSEENNLPTSGAKEVQWSAYTDPALQGSGGEVESYDDFFASLGEGEIGNFQTEAEAAPGYGTRENKTLESSYIHAEYQGTTGAYAEQLPNGENTYSVEYWESLYPGWKYDPNTAQWYQLHGSDGTKNGQESFGFTGGNVQSTFDADGHSPSASSDVQSYQVSYEQQTAQYAVGDISQYSTTENMSGLNSVLQQDGKYQYPVHMIFDPQYPGWYYDTILQQWCSLEAYHALVQSTDQTRNQNGFFSSSANSHNSSQGTNHIDGPQGPSSERGLNNFSATSSAEYGQQGGTAQFGMVGTSAENDFQLFSHVEQVPQNGPAQYATDFYNSQHAATVGQPFSSNGHYGSYTPSEGRSSAGRPPHALVTFGFGGKLVVMKDNCAGGFSTIGSKNGDGCFLSVLNMMEVVSLNNGPSSTEIGAHSYFNYLCHQSFPGPLVGGNVGSKELNKWIDERIANSESLEMNYGKGQGLKLLLSLLKIACQHYGKLRSFGGDTGLKENDLPESAVAKLFASAKRNDDQFSESKCLLTLPSEAYMQTTASEVQKLLIAGRKMEALHRAQEGQFWGFALILARELGEQFYADTVKQMAVSQLVVGSPLRTLCLLIARKPEEVFSNSILPPGNIYGAVNTPQLVQNEGCSMLDNWEENLAVISANRTENDHLVIIHLGDCLLKEKNDVTAAHICYLVAEAGFELYSDSARLCLIGADHWNSPRTYANPEAIQRTELFEYAKFLGNSQYVLLQLQAYKLIYAHMLAEVGKVSDSLKYCQAVNKSLKIGRSSEVDTLKQLLSSLEERIRTHQQSGYAANLAPAKIVGKLLNFFDSTAHRVVGGLPPPGPSSLTTPSSFQGNENQFQTLAPKVIDNQSIMGVSSMTPSASMNIMSSQSTMGMSSLTPSASMEPISQWAVDESKMTLQNRSISEPDIGRTPRPDPVSSANESTSSSTVGKQSGSTRTSRFGRLNFGAQILQKTVGLVLGPRQGRQAKLGDANKFYYDEKLKRWVEEGVEPTPEESAPPPPPVTGAFQNGNSDYNLKNALNDGLNAVNGSPGSITSTPESSPVPPSLPSSNQFSARNRMGVRSRYVDTFNKGGGASTNLFQAPSIPSAKPVSMTGAKFFIPTAAPTNEQTSGAEAGNRNEVSESGEKPFMSMNDPFQNLAPSPVGTIQRFPSVGNIPSKSTTEGGKSSLAPQSRRTASWSAMQTDPYTLPPTTEIKASPLSFMPSNQLTGDLHMNRDNSGDDLQEVEL